MSDLTEIKALIAAPPSVRTDGVLEARKFLHQNYFEALVNRHDGNKHRVDYLDPAFCPGCAGLIKLARLLEQVETDALVLAEVLREKNRS